MPKLIAEFKRSSPWDGPVTDEPLESVVSRYEADTGVWGISVVADRRWGGYLTDIKYARRHTNKPLLAKGLDIDPWMAHKLGADFVLTYSPRMAAFMSPVAWLEVHSTDDLKAIQDHGRGFPGIVVANNRDVETGELVPGNAEALSRAVPPGTMVVAASGYKDPEEASWADAVIIGTHLLKEEER